MPTNLATTNALQAERQSTNAGQLVAQAAQQQTHSDLRSLLTSLNAIKSAVDTNGAAEVNAAAIRDAVNGVADSRSKDGVPVLSSLPLIGPAFTRSQTNNGLCSVMVLGVNRRARKLSTLAVIRGT